MRQGTLDGTSCFRNGFISANQGTLGPQLTAVRGLACWPILTLAIAAAGCFGHDATTETVETGEDRVWRGIDRRIDGDLEVESGARLVLERMVLTIRGEATIRGTLELRDATLKLEPGATVPTLAVRGGTVDGYGLSYLSGVDGLTLVDGRLSWQDGEIQFGRLFVLESSTLIFNRTYVTASGETDGGQIGTATYNVMDGSDVRFEAVIASAGEYFVDQDSHIRFVSTYVDILDLAGPGLKERASRLLVHVQNPSGASLTNATVAVVSVQGVTHDDGVTNPDGDVRLEPVYFDHTTVPNFYDPHYFVVDGQPAAGINIAANGDATVTVVAVP